MLHLFKTPPSTPRDQGENLSYEGEHANFRWFIYTIVRQAITKPNFLTYHDSLLLLRIAIDDEQDNLYGNHSSAALTSYRALYRHLERTVLAENLNGFEDRSDYLDLVDVKLDEWINNCFSKTPHLCAQLQQLRAILVDNAIDSGPIPVTP